MLQNPQATDDGNLVDGDAVRAVIDDCLSRRAAGDAISDEAIIAAHLDLMPALGEELRRLRVIAAARQRATMSSDEGGDTPTHHGSVSGSNRLEVRCPNCHEPTKVAVDTLLTDLTCTACGSHFSLVDQSKATRMAPSLTKLGRFELIERIGVGGFGSVWKARDKELDRTVAIKIPRHGGMTTQEQEKFFREARAAAQLRHSNIVRVYEVGRDGDSVYIVSDYIRGVTLGDWLTGQQFTSREAAELCAKIADGLHHAHEQGIVHRDLKPANIMMDGDGEPHLMDFGLARREAGEVTVTVDGQVLGTPSYMSPEQAQGESHTADRRSDVYSLGVILFQLLTGELPFRGNARMIMHQVIHDEPPSPRKLNVNVARDLETITLKCMEKTPARRYQSSKELTAELRRFLSGSPIHARSIGRIERGWRWCRRNPALAGLAAAFLTALVAAIVVLAVSNARIRRESEEKALALNEKDAALATAREAVDKMLTRTASETLADVPLAQSVRQKLLEDALTFYEGFLGQSADDESLRIEKARVLTLVGTIQRDLSRYSEAQQAYEQAIALLEPLYSAAPDSIDYGAALAECEFLLGFLLDYSGNSTTDNPAHNCYRRSLAIYDRLESEHPDRLQPAAQPLHRIAKNAEDRGDRGEATQLYRDAISRGEQYLRQQPADIVARTQLCWSCYELAGLLGDSEREPVFETGLRHARTLLEQNAEYGPGIQVSGDLTAFFGEFLCRTDRYDRGRLSIEQGVQQIQKCCAAAPTISWYWDSFGFALDCAAALKPEDRGNLASSLRTWLARVAARIPDDPASQRHVYTYQRDVARLLAQTGRTDEANDLVRSLMEALREDDALSVHNTLEAIVVADRMLWIPLELLPAVELGQEVEQTILPALDNLASDDKALRTAAEGLVSRWWDIQQVNVDAAFKIVDKLAELTRDKPDFASIRLELAWRLIAPDTPPLQQDERFTSLVEKAAAEVEASVKGQPENVMNYYFLALLRLWFEDENAYRNACDAMAKQFEATTDDNARYLLLWTCGLGGALDDLSQPLSYAQHLVEQHPNNPQYRIALGILLYRTKDYETALRQLAKAVERLPHDTTNQTSVVYAQYLLAMSQWHLGNTIEAQRLLTEATAAEVEARRNAPGWNRLATIDLLHREATALIPLVHTGVPAVR